MQPELVVMAAGLGSRFGGPKQVVPVGPGGERLVDYAVFDALRAGLGRVTFVIRRDMQAAFHEAVGARYAGRLEVAYAFQEPDQVPAGCAAPPGRTKPWGTGHAVLAAAPAVRAPFVVINADDYYGPAAFATAAAFLREGAAAAAGPARFAMVAWRLANTLSEHGTVSRGVCDVAPDGRLRGVTEHTALTPCPGGARDKAAAADSPALAGDTPVSMNFWAFTPAVFAQLAGRFARFLDEHGHEPGAEFFLPAAVEDAVRAGEATVDVLSTPDPWFGLTYPGDREHAAARLHALAADGTYPDPLWP